MAPPPPDDQRLDKPVIILVNPQLGENIGQAARAMANFGLGALRLVAPRDGWPSEPARRAASAGAARVIEEVALFPTVEAAIGDLHFLCATSARGRQMSKPTLSLEAGLAALRTRQEAGRRCGVLFGPERAGLENDHVALADILISAPVGTGFPSLNLAHAVLLVCYEIGRQAAGPAPAPGRPAATVAAPPATRAELLQFFEHLERELDASGFLRPPEKRPALVANIRSLFERVELSQQEVRTLRGVIASLCRAHRPRPKAP